MKGPNDPSGILDAMAGAGRRLVLVATGGGTRVISDLCGIPGASRVVLEGLVPYARDSVDRLLGGPQEQYCDRRIARRLAVAAWQRAAAVATPESAIGAAVTASLVTLEPKRGAHRVHAAVQTASATHAATVELVKGARTRSQEEAVAAELMLALLAVACGHGLAAGSAGPECFEGLGLREEERVVRESFEPPVAWQRLFTGAESVVPAVPAPGDEAAKPGAGCVVFPGSFDPLHEGHRLMARIAGEIAEASVSFELSITNVDKPTLDFQEIRDRLTLFEPSAAVWLTRAATFVEKTSLFPRAVFVMGADTYRRLGDPRYYGGSKESAAVAVDRIASAIEGLIVFGRVAGGRFEDASRIDAPEAIRRKAYFVSELEFRMDVSSTEIRRKATGCGTP